MQDRNSRNIVIALVSIAVMTTAVVIAAIFVPFRVNQIVRVISASGEAELLIPGRPAQPLDMSQDDEPVLKPGQGVRVSPGGTVTLVFELNQGRAILHGPAEVTLVESYRRATMPGHASESGSLQREYRLTLEQVSGRVQYDFSHISPALTDINLVIQLPDSSFKPTTPCWTIEVSVEGTSNAQPSEC
jgi:hypothetical protein